MSWYRRLLIWLHQDDDESAFAGSPAVQDTPGCVCLSMERVGDVVLSVERIGDLTLTTERFGDVTLSIERCNCN